MNERKESMTDWVEAYALGGLDEAEAAELEALLMDDADERQRAAELKDTVAMLALAVKPAAPPTGMKRRILANVLGSETADRTSGLGEDKSSAGETQLILEQARQTVEVDAARREAEKHSGIDGSGSSKVSDTTDGVVHSGSRNTDGAALSSGDKTAAPIRGESRSARRAPETGSTVSEMPAAAETARSAARARAARGLWAGVASIMAVAAVLLGVYSSQLHGEINDMRSDMTAMQQRTTDMERQLASAAQPAVGAQVARTVPLVGSEDDPDASGMAAMVQEANGMRLVVQAEDLPELSGSEAYQVWLIKDDQPINAGTFLSDSGSGALAYTMEPGDYDMVAITLEPDAEGDQPRGRMVLTGAVNS